MTGHIIRRVTKRGLVRYDAVVAVGRSRVWKTFTTRKGAEDYVADNISEVGAGTYRRVASALLADVFAKWTESLVVAESMGQIKKSSRRSFTSVVTRHLIPAFGNIESDQLTTRHVAAWKAECAEAIAANRMTVKSFNNHVGCLKVALDWAREQHYLKGNPLPKRLRGKRKSVTRRIVEGAEIARLWRSASGVDQVIIGLALFAGLRRGEVFGARWSDITWPKGRTRAALRVEQAYVQREVVTPKSDAGRRLVYLPARLVELLRQYECACPPIRLRDGTAYVVRQDDGTPLDPDNWTKRTLPTIRTAAKLPEEVTLHALRHTFGSLLLSENVPVKHVSEQMGHANVAITLDVYQHILKSTSATATRRLDKHIPTRRPTLRLVKRGAA